ncbi:cytochrome P450 89A2-like [Miscanthus floridulus]|uniref:cytochrome P450 89A2-like n=1 Tax=Miscanthus floridulus TaxID=154761 RepID=UPI0034587320
MVELGLTLRTLPVPLLSVSLAASVLYLLHRSHGRKNPKKSSGKASRPPLPPGPPPPVFLAKLFSLMRRPRFDIGPFLRELHARHGPVVTLRLLTTTVFVADRRIAHRVLVQDGAAFADRPPLVEPNPLFNAGNINSAPYGPYWRLVRRNLAAETLHRARLGLFAPARRWACDVLIASLLRDVDSSECVVTVRPFLQRAMSELLAYMCFGERLPPDVLDEIDTLERHALRTATSFPVFAIFPPVTKRIFRKRWAAHVAVRRRQEEVYAPLIHATSAADDDQPPCYAKSLLALRVADDGDRQLTDAEMVSLCSEFLNAGTDTTVTLLEWIMAELVNHPDVQAKVYEEVITAKRELDDAVNLQALPYLKAVVLEGLRLHPPGHYLVPHAVRSDAEIGGYTVPKGAEVNFMVAEIGRDESVWTAAREFRPERFLDGGEGNGVDITGSREIKMMPFGAGRRMCPGYTLGMHHAEFFVGSLVRELEWLPAAEGVTVNMEETVDFTTVMKYPLHARIVPRNKS